MDLTTVEKQLELEAKIIKGLELAYERLLEYKRYKKSELVIMKDGKIVKIKP